MKAIDLKVNWTKVIWASLCYANFVFLYSVHILGQSICPRYLAEMMNELKNA